MSSQISEGQLESSVGAIYDDFDSDEGVGAHWYRLGHLCSHDGRDKQPCRLKWMLGVAGFAWVLEIKVRDWKWR
jgi:hypothetical protein